MTIPTDDLTHLDPAEFNRRYIDRQLQDFDQRREARRQREREARLAREDELQQEAQQARAELGKADLKQFQDEMQAGWLANGGSQADFDREWPSMRRRFLERQATAAVDGRRQSLSDQVRRWL